MFHEKKTSREMVVSSEPIDGPFLSVVKGAAAAHSISVVIGMNEKIANEERVYNTMAAIDDRGSLTGVYRKLHLYDAFGGRESDWVRPGDHDQPLTFSVNGVTMGVMTCYDLRFPELARELVDRGAEVLLLPAHWTPGPRKEDHWITLSRARAIENTAYFVALSQPAPQSTGNSIVVDPMGVVIMEMSEEEGIGYADVSAERVSEVRKRNPTLDHRRFTVTAV